MKMVITSRIAKFPFPGMTTTKSKLLLYIAAKMKRNLTIQTNWLRENYWTEHIDIFENDWRFLVVQSIQFAQCFPRQNDVASKRVKNSTVDDVIKQIRICRVISKWIDCVWCAWRHWTTTNLCADKAGIDHRPVLAMVPMQPRCDHRCFERDWKRRGWIQVFSTNASTFLVYPA